MSGLIKNLQQEIGESSETVNAAVGENAKTIAYALKSLGKKCSPRWVAAQGEQSKTVKRRNFQEVYKIWIAAFFLSGNASGAELLLNDLELFVRQCREVNERNKSLPPKKVTQILTRIRTEIVALEDCWTA